MFKKVLIGLVAAIGIFVIVVALQPSEFRLERSTVIAAPAAVVFPLVNDFHNWTTWSPWEKLDPNSIRTYSGANAGTGAIYDWNGNEQAGQGRMTILESVAPSLVRINLEFIKPYAGTNLTEFTFAENQGQTTVKWVMSGKNNFMSKMFCLFVNMDKMVGGDFEKGLAAMKAASEAQAPK